MTGASPRASPTKDRLARIASLPIIKGASPTKTNKGASLASHTGGRLSRGTRLQLLLAGASIISGLLTVMLTYHMREGYHGTPDYYDGVRKRVLRSTKGSTLGCGSQVPQKMWKSYTSTVTDLSHRELRELNETKGGFLVFLEQLAWKLDKPGDALPLIKGQLAKLGHPDPINFVANVSAHVPKSTGATGGEHRQDPSNIKNEMNGEFREFLEHLAEKLDQPQSTKALLENKLLKLGNPDPAKFLEKAMSEYGQDTAQLNSMRSSNQLKAKLQDRAYKGKKAEQPKSPGRGKVPRLPFCRNVGYPILKRDMTKSDTPHPGYDRCVAEASKIQYIPTNPVMKRGVVICIYNSILSLGLSLIKELRCHGMEMPIEVHHCTSKEMSPASKADLEKQAGVTVVDTCQGLSKEEATPFMSFWLKPLALLKSNFDEVMIMDADDVFAQDPSYLWQDEGYRRTGTLLFYDRAINRPEFLIAPDTYPMPYPMESSRNGLNGNTPRYENCTLTKMEKLILIFPFKNLTETSRPGCRQASHKNRFIPSPRLQRSLVWTNLTAHYQDSSLLLWDKTRHPRALQALRILISKEYRDMEYAWGDKESFWLSLELAGDDYHMSPWGAATINVPGDLSEHQKYFCGSLAQYAPSGDGPQELLYINARAAVYAGLPKNFKDEPVYNFHNEKPASVTERSSAGLPGEHTDFGPECLPAGRNPLQIPQSFLEVLSRRRLFYNSLVLGTTFGLDQC